MKRIATLLVLLAACSDTTPTGTNQLNIDRPVDISFACFGGLRVTNGQPPTANDEVTVSAQPYASCDIRSGNDGQGIPVPVMAGSGSGTPPPPTPPGQEPISGGDIIPPVSWFGFILQSEPGTVAVSDWPTKASYLFMGGEVSMEDANPLTPGRNSISV